MSNIRVYWWSESGEVLGLSLVDALPPVGACLYMRPEHGGPRVVVQHWIGKPSTDDRVQPMDDWHIVLRPAGSPSEQVPPWERNKDEG
jgi:hypothetical protein